MTARSTDGEVMKGKKGKKSVVSGLYEFIEKGRKANFFGPEKNG